MSNADWWAKKLGNPQPIQQGRPANVPAMPPSQQPMAPMPTFQAVNQGERAQSAKQTATCPDCGSGNYMAIQNAAPRCFDCGYPLEQSGSRYGSLAGAHVEGSAKAASGNDATNNWNPQGIIGRIDG
jgi:ribosomal protein S27AE